MSIHTLPDTIEFNRPKKFRVLRVLGSGACGQTVLLKDEEMSVEFVAKKYKPIVSKTSEASLFKELLDRFKTEARILFKLNYPNIVRVFNFYDYEEFDTAYIIMEFISGDNLSDYLLRNPDKIDAVFEKTIDGFAHLEAKNILHRDIRPMNILVSDSGEPKIIDFGFGKALEIGTTGSDRSITLNWWCEPPPEIAQAKYDFQTEVYFVGKLFEQAVMDGNLTEFKHRDVLREMCRPDRASRVQSFAEIQRRLAGAGFSKLSFTDGEVKAYRGLADTLTELISRVGHDAVFNNDIHAIILSLENLLHDNILEEFLPDPSKLGRIFVKGAFWYSRNELIPVGVIERFLGVIKALPVEKRAIVMRNLFSRLNSIERNEPPSDIDDELPF